MSARIYRWSPRPQAEHHMRNAAHEPVEEGLEFSELAWNLAWLSFPFEDRFPDNPERLGEAVVKTLEARLMTSQGVIDMPRALRMSAMSFALVVGAATNYRDLPITRLLGRDLKFTWRERANLARSDHPASLERLADYPTPDLRAAQAVLKRFTLQ